MNAKNDLSGHADSVEWLLHEISDSGGAASPEDYAELLRRLKVELDAFRPKLFDLSPGDLDGLPKATAAYCKGEQLLWQARRAMEGGGR